MIESAESELGVVLPDDYLALVRAHNGGEGWVGKGAYMSLWPIEELVENNRMLEAGLLVPGAILLGTDGGGELYGFEPASGSYLTFPAVGLSAELGRKLGGSWDAFLQALSEA